MNPTLALLLSAVYDGALAPEHRADLEKSGLTDATIRQQNIRSCRRDLIDRLLGFPTPEVTSAYLLPFPDPRGGWMDHVRMKVFPPHTDREGHGEIPAAEGLRRADLLPARDARRVLHSDAPLYIVEGEKKALRSRRPASRRRHLRHRGLAPRRREALHPDLDDVGLAGRVVNLIPDADVRTNPAVAPCRPAASRAPCAPAAPPVSASSSSPPTTKASTTTWCAHEPPRR